MTTITLSKPVLDDILTELNTLKSSYHYTCDDPFYSCPKSPDGESFDEALRNKCNCGTDTRNAKIDSIINRLKGG